MPSIVQGSIVWAVIPDSRGGNPKNRPAVVLTSNSQIDPQGEVELAAITSLLGDARFSETVELPWHPDGHPQTGLSKPSEVVCTWLAATRAVDVSDSGKILPPQLLFEVLDKVNAFK